jgi:hypothetical protein
MDVRHLPKKEQGAWIAKARLRKDKQGGDDVLFALVRIAWAFYERPLDCPCSGK